MTRKLLLTLTLLIFSTVPLWGQADSIGKIQLSGYAELYYTYDFGEPANHERPWFLFNHKRHNEVSLNLAYLKAQWATDRVRASVALMAGTYAQYNLAAEQPMLQSVYEAQVGVKIAEKWWLDVGVMPSNMGFESAVSKDCWTLTRSLAAENSPYYLAAAKLSFQPVEALTVAAYLSNGWQRIARVGGNQSPAFGTEIHYTPNDRLTLHSGSFIGNDYPQGQARLRVFHNFYGIFQLTDRLGLITGFDLGAEKQPTGGYALWYTPVTILRLQASEKIALAARLERFHDSEQVIIATNTPNGFRTNSASINLDFQIVPQALFRIEARGFDSRDAVFTYQSRPHPRNFFLATSLAVGF